MIDNYDLERIADGYKSPDGPDFILLYQVLGKIQVHPEQFNQKVYGQSIVNGPICETAFCVAGHAAVMKHPKAIIQWTADRSAYMPSALPEGVMNKYGDERTF